MRDEADFVKVLDFGVSKIKAARTKLTRATAVIGTPDYMSPEQATGLIEEIDHRTDQWALACIAWEMLSGHAPFIADDMGALFYQVINMDPHPLARRAPGLPAGVEPVLRRALAKRAGNRYPSIKDFARAFEAAAAGQATRADAGARSRSAPAPVAKGTVGYADAVVPPPSDWEAKTEAAPPPRMVAEEMVENGSRRESSTTWTRCRFARSSRSTWSAAGVAVLADRPRDRALDAQDAARVRGAGRRSRPRSSFPWSRSCRRLRRRLSRRLLRRRWRQFGRREQTGQAGRGRRSSARLSEAEPLRRPVRARSSSSEVRGATPRTEAEPSRSRNDQSSRSFDHERSVAGPSFAPGAGRTADREPRGQDTGAGRC